MANNSIIILLSISVFGKLMNIVEGACIGPFILFYLLFNFLFVGFFLFQAFPFEHLLKVSINVLCIIITISIIRHQHSSLSQ